MNILFVNTSEFSRNAGGVGTVTYALTKEFLKKECNVYYMSLKKGDEKLTDFNGIRHFFIPDETNFIAPENTNFIKQLLNKYDIDIIINQAGFNVPALKGLNAAKNEKVKIITVHHNCILCLYKNYRHIITKSYGSHRFFKLINNPIGWFLLNIQFKIKHSGYFKFIINNSDKLALLSVNFIEELKFFVKNLPEDKVVAISNPAPYEAVPGIEDKKENILLYIGRIEYQQKRTDLLLEIWKLLYKKHPDWKLEVIGEGPARNDLEKKIKSENIERVTFHGFQDPKALLEKAKFFCMTSAFEGYGMVLVESQAYGVVPFAFDCFTGLNEIIKNGSTGKVIKPFDINEYASELEKLMTNESERMKIAIEGQKAVEKFNASKIADEWINLFKKLLNSKPIR
ncbi:MAG: glycosyltransferase [Bacteroidetes bacterium]|nr:glycosyltransferase [Bacteroidota bacterium]